MAKKQSFSVLKIFAVELLLSNIRQFQKCLGFLRQGVCSPTFCEVCKPVSLPVNVVGHLLLHHITALTPSPISLYGTTVVPHWARLNYDTRPTFYSVW